MNLTAAKITTSHFLDLEDIMQSTDIDADDVSFIERARVLERDLRSTLLQTGDATVGVKVRCDKVQMLRKQLKHEREAKIKLQDISDKNLKTVAMLTDHVEKLVFFLSISQKAKLKAERNTKDLRRECSRLRAIIEKQEQGLSIHQQLIVQLKSTSCVLEEQLFDMDDAYLRMKSNVVSLIKELSESKALTNMEKDNNDNNNDKKVFNDGKKLKEISNEYSYEGNAVINYYKKSDNNYDKKSTNNNDIHNNCDRNSNIIRKNDNDDNNNNNSNTNKNNKNAFINNNNNNDKDNNHNRSGDIEYLSVDPFAFQPDYSYTDDGFESESGNEIGITSDISYINASSRSNKNKSDDDNNSNNDDNNDISNNDNNSNDNNDINKTFICDYIDDDSDNLLMNTNNDSNRCEIILPENNNGNNIQKSIKIRSKSASAAVTGASDYDVKGLLAKLGIGVVEKKRKKPVMVFNRKNEIRVKNDNDDDYDNNNNNNRSNTNNNNHEIYNSDINNMKKTMQFNHEGYSSSSDKNNKHHRNRKVKSSMSDWRNFFQTDISPNSQNLSKNDKKTNCKGNPEIKRIDHIINKIRRKNNMPNSDVKWTPERLLELMENKIIY